MRREKESEKKEGKTLLLLGDDLRGTYLRTHFFPPFSHSLFSFTERQQNQNSGRETREESERERQRERERKVSLFSIKLEITHKVSPPPEVHPFPTKKVNRNLYVKNCLYVVNLSRGLRMKVTQGVIS